MRQLMMIVLIAMFAAVAWAQSGVPKISPTIAETWKVQDDAQVGSPHYNFWTSDDVLASVEGMQIQLALLDPDTAIDTTDPESNVPGFAYPRIFEPTDPISYTMIDRAITQRHAAARLVQIRDELTASKDALVTLKASIDAIQTELVTNRAETSRVAAAIENLVTTGITVIPDNTTVLNMLQQMLDQAKQIPTIQ